jgi:8-oxo-dGTP pyrophosphatase MutT (NUDIX family)
MERVEQAGGIAFRREQGKLVVMLVKSKKNPAIWVFPKGHIEPGERPDETAVRETREESGVEGQLLGPIGQPLEFDSGREPVRVQYFLIRATTDKPSSEGRQKGWFTIADAMGRLAFESSRALLAEAVAAIE